MNLQFALITAINQISVSELNESINQQWNQQSNWELKDKPAIQTQSEFQSWNLNEFNAVIELISVEWMNSGLLVWWTGLDVDSLTLY